MNPVKAVVFDLGKVLVDFDYAIAARRILPRSTAGAVQLQRWIADSALFRDYETGLLTTEQFFTAVQAAIGFRGDLAEFGHYFADIFTPIPAMVSLHEEIRNRGLPTYIFSNTNELSARHIHRRFPFYGRFTGHVLSCEHQAMKPDPRLYEVLERMAGLNGADLLYVDDRPENIETGRQRGWQVVLHQTPAETRTQFRRAGVVA
jgi:HAD superfamily hydrolase (TIGR01509 family)